MESRLNGLAISKNTGAVNGTLRAINYDIPENTAVIIENPVIAPSEKVKIGDCLVGSNGYVGQITNISVDQGSSTTLITVTGLGFSVSSEQQENEPIEILYSDLRELYNSGELLPKQEYKIIDYETTINDNIDYATVISHPFDIIVKAKNNHSLYEYAKASKKENDDYYLEDLSKWELKYSLIGSSWSKDFNTNGKGAIIWMKDSHGNECPYDFKQIAFKRYKIISSVKSPDLIGSYSISGVPEVEVDLNDYEYLYTFYDIFYNPLKHTNVITDSSNSDGTGNSIFDVPSNNVISEYIQIVEELNNITIRGVSSSNIFNNNCRNISLGTNCSHNEFSDSCRDIVFGEDCNYNKFFNTDKSDNGTNSIVFSNNCSCNTFNGIASLIYLNGSYTCNNEFGNDVSNIEILTNCSNNVFKSGCNDIALGEYSTFNTFGYSCTKIRLYGLIGIGMGYAKHMRYNNFGDGSKYYTLYHDYESESEQEENPIQYCIVLPGSVFDEDSPEEFEAPAGATACVVIGSIYSN